MRWSIATAVAAVGVLVFASPGRTYCGDPDSVHAARTMIEQVCDCGRLPTHKVYAACARAVVRNLVARGDLTETCRAKVMRCANRSVCGSLGAVACRITIGDVPSCRIVPSEADCQAPEGGTACVSSAKSCCEGQSPTGCASTTPCGSSAFPSCGGSCPSGTICQAFSIDGQAQYQGCYCTQPTTPCGPGACSESGGACLAGQVCYGIVGGGGSECGCGPAPNSCR